MAMESVYYQFDMGVTSPTTRRCKRFSHQLYKEHVASTMLQVFSLRFTGVDQKPLSIYGFVAVRDDCEPRRNYILNLAREEAFDLSPDTPLLPLTWPSRGISVWKDALVEINLKAKHNDSTCDDVLVDVCIKFRYDRIERGKKLKSRIDGPFGTFYMDYMFIKHGVEAVVEVEIPKEFIGDHVLIIARSTWFKDDMVIYDAVFREESPTISVVIAASEGGRLFLGFLAMGARACGCTSFKVKKSGCQEDYVHAYPQPQPIKADVRSECFAFQPIRADVGSECFAFQPIRGDVQSECFAFKPIWDDVQSEFSAFKPIRDDAFKLFAFLVIFRVTYSTMGYYNCGI